MVVANAVAALSEIQELGGKPVLDLTLGTVSKLLRALNECTEWGQVSAVLSGKSSSQRRVRHSVQLPLHPSLGTFCVGAHHARRFLYLTVW